MSDDLGIIDWVTLIAGSVIGVILLWFFTRRRTPYNHFFNLTDKPVREPETID